MRGQPGYWPSHDRDNDGIACETYWPWLPMRLLFWVRGQWLEPYGGSSR